MSAATWPDVIAACEALGLSPAEVLGALGNLARVGLGIRPTRAIAKYAGEGRWTIGYEGPTGSIATCTVYAPEDVPRACMVELAREAGVDVPAGAAWQWLLPAHPSRAKG